MIYTSIPRSKQTNLVTLLFCLSQLTCLVVAIFILLTATGLKAAPLGEYKPVAARQVITGAFPLATEIQPLEDNRAIKALYAQDELIGYTYQTLDFLQTPAYSGKPLDATVVLDAEGKINAARVIHHNEPILLIGIPQKKCMTSPTSIQV